MLKNIFILSLLLSLTVLAEEPVSKSQIVYLMRAGEAEQSIELYQHHLQNLGKQDFEVLRQMALALLDAGAKSLEQEKQLLSIYGSAIAGSELSLDILEAGVQSPHPETQIASIQLLGKLQDDRIDAILIKAMSSPLFYTRLEAALQLAIRKHPSAVGHIEALMHRVPFFARGFFPQFFGLIGTSDSINILRSLLDDRHDIVRIEAILSAARFGRDDLLPQIRAAATHTNIAIREACCYALGRFKDTRSKAQLQKLKMTNVPAVKLAACHALYSMGEFSAEEPVMQLAREHDLHAIALLGEFPSSKELLAELCGQPDVTIRFNAAMALLKHRDPRCMDTILEMIIRDNRDYGFHPQFSLGKTLMHWKISYSAGQQHFKQAMYNLSMLTMQLREQLLSDCLELPEENFLFVGRKIFESKQISLVPLLVSLLEHLQTKGSIALLKEFSQFAGAPFIRAYCNLALLRLKEKGPYEQLVEKWIAQNQQSELIRFRPVLPMDQRLSDSPFELTPEDSSRLLIDSYLTLADRHETRDIDALLAAIKNGHPKNRYALAGLLLRAIQ